jgi:ABC-type sugar transport system substrate-binding protein
MGADAVRMAAKILSGEQFEKDNVIESITVTKDNVDEYIDKGY